MEALVIVYFVIGVVLSLYHVSGTVVGVKLTFWQSLRRDLGFYCVATLMWPIVLDILLTNKGKWTGGKKYERFND